MLLLILLVSNLLAMPVFYIIIKSRFNADKMLSEIRIEVDKLVLELGREADRDVALLESRISGLRNLMEEANRRILLADQDSSRRREIEIKKADLPSIKTEAIVTSEPVINQVPPVIKSVPIKEKIEPIIIYTRPMPVTKTSTPEPITPVLSTKESVLSLVKKGFSSDLIASQLSLSLGEVELILNMNSSSL